MIDKKIQEYAERFTSAESGILRAIRERTAAERDDRSMLSGFYQGRLLSMLSRIIGPRRVLEIGTYMGYSALCLAEGLVPGGRVLTLDVDPETNALARGYWAEAGMEELIEARLGPALEIIPDLDESFDLVFIDADKENYSAYYDLVFPKVRIGGLIVADNVLWSGAVLDADVGGVDSATAALHAYNRKVSEDGRVSCLLLAVRDGLMVARKEAD